MCVITLQNYTGTLFGWALCLYCMYLPSALDRDQVTVTELGTNFIELLCRSRISHSFLPAQSPIRAAIHGEHAQRFRLTSHLLPTLNSVAHVIIESNV